LRREIAVAPTIASLERRPLGESGLFVSPVALGCWPIAGVTTLDTNHADSIATIQASFELGTISTQPTPMAAAARARR
jgi:hypothetical protein